MNEPLKNMYNQQYVTDLAAAIKKEYPTFDGETFAARVLDEGWDARELKQRMRHITVVMHDFFACRLPRRARYPAQGIAPAG